MRIEAAGLAYEWLEDWARLPDTPALRNGWAHPGLAVTESDWIITFHPGDPSVLLLSPDGDLLNSFNTGLTEGHGVTAIREGMTDHIWIADSGTKTRLIDGHEDRVQRPGRVMKLTMDGVPVLELDRPDLEAYQNGRYSPTSVAVNDVRSGGNGDIWVADGYGQSLVHRYDSNGLHIGTITGEEGEAGRFTQPHGIWMNTRHPIPELYIGDRGNNRVQVYDPEGKYLRSFGENFLRRPSAFAAYEGLLFIAELDARVSVLDDRDRLLGDLGSNVEVSATDGWPNVKDASGVPSRTTRLEVRRFNSPHGIGVDSAGNLYVTEWLLGGRVTKLLKV